MVSWQRHSRGGVPHNALWAGLDADGSNIYVGRATHERDLLPGKVVPNKGGLFVAWGGAEHSKHDYEVLCNWHAVAWQQSSGGHVPPRAIVGGHTANGERLYIGRVLHNGALTPGKVHGSHRKCYIPFGGRELAFDRYEVLISV
ncbi:hypothetical protein R5R35_010350 [Gryllus longicercus]|uniref:Uncharacterized protein n=1 Tax=Gryllus longicercus TaxID=2509291 RepID=A0AAN9W0B8_9ORTH